MYTSGLIAKGLIQPLATPKKLLGVLKLHKFIKTAVPHFAFTSTVFEENHIGNRYSCATHTILNLAFLCANVNYRLQAIRDTISYRVTTFSWIPPLHSVRYICPIPHGIFANPCDIPRSSFLGLYSTTAKSPDPGAWLKQNLRNLRDYENLESKLQNPEVKNTSWSQILHLTTGCFK